MARRTTGIPRHPSAIRKLRCTVASSAAIARTISDYRRNELYNLLGYTISRFVFSVGNADP